MGPTDSPLLQQPSPQPPESTGQNLDWLHSSHLCHLVTRWHCHRRKPEYDELKLCCGELLQAQTVSKIKRQKKKKLFSFLKYLFLKQQGRTANHSLGEQKIRFTRWMANWMMVYLLISICIQQSPCFSEFNCIFL